MSVTASIEEAFEQFKKLPDWDRFPMPEVFYQHFGVKKPRAAALNEVICYQPPPYQSLNEGGKVEIRGPVEGGVRQIGTLDPLPVVVKRRNEETDELEEYPAPKKQVSWEDKIREAFNERLKEQSASYNPSDSEKSSSSPPIEDDTKGTPPE